MFEGEDSETLHHGIFIVRVTHPSGLLYDAAEDSPLSPWSGVEVVGTDPSRGDNVTDVSSTDAPFTALNDDSSRGWMLGVVLDGGLARPVCSLSSAIG